MFLFNSKKFHWKKIIIASIILTVIDVVVRQIEAFMTMKYYLMPEYFGLWSKLMMPKPGPPPAEFFIISILFSFLTSLVLATVFVYVKDVFPKQYWMRVLGYAKITILFMLVFSYLPMILLINVPYTLLASWFTSSALIVITGTVIFVKMLNK